MFDDQSAARPASPHEIGMDLAALSVGELRERLELLRGEIARLEAELERKGSSIAAAESLFSRS